MLIDDHVDGNKAGAESQPSKSQARCANTVDIVGAIGALPINPTAKLVAITMRTTRVVDSKALAAMLGLSMRVIQKSKNEYATASDECGESSEPGFANRTNPANQDSLSPAPRVHARAQMEYPTDINLSQKVASKAHEEGEIAGLNGSTHRFVDMLAGWLAGDLRPKEPDAARAILIGNVEHYGADKVKAGMLELQVAIGTGQKPRDPGKAFSGFVKNAKPPRADEPPKLTKVEERKAHGLKLLEGIRARAAAAEAVA